MCKRQWLVLSAALAVIVTGCGKSAGKGDAATSANVASSIAKLDGPAQAAYDFLEAVRTGNDEKARSLLSAVAREKTAALNRSVTPAASDTAKFTVGKVERVNQDGRASTARGRTSMKTGNACLTKPSGCCGWKTMVGGLPA